MWKLSRLSSTLDLQSLFSLSAIYEKQWTTERWWLEKWLGMSTMGTTKENHLNYWAINLFDVAGVTVSNARVLVSPNSGKSIVGRDWLAALHYKITQSIETGECNVIKQPVKSNKVICDIVPRISKVPEVQQLEGEIPNLFKGKGGVKKVRQQKAREFQCS